jgi:hypothetical protein
LKLRGELVPYFCTFWIEASGGTCALFLYVWDLSTFCLGFIHIFC